MYKPRLVGYRIKNVLQSALIGAIFGTVLGFITSFGPSSSCRSNVERINYGYNYRVKHWLFWRGCLLLQIKKKAISFFTINTNSFIYIRPVLLLVIVNAASLAIFEHTSIKNAIVYYLFEVSFDRDIIMVTISAFIIISLLQIRRLHSKGDLTKFILGVYHRPKEIERIFLFIDLKSSTSIAEKPGNIKYSEFLIDYYYDITEALLIAGAEIYQNVGDEIILSWSFKKGIQDARCINCFFD